MLQRMRTTLAAAFAAFCLARPDAVLAEAPPDVVFVHGEIYTVDAARSWAQAIAVRDRKIVFVGDDAAALALRGPATRVVDLGGRFVLPGFSDSHTHPVSSGRDLDLCDLSAAETRADVETAVRTYAAAHPDRPWIVGAGWALPLFADANPKREDLDRLVPDRPAALSAADGHSTWANSRALALAGIDANTPDPPNGRIERDPRGVPTGTLREAAQERLRAVMPSATAEERLAGLRRAVALAHSFGITSIFEASAERGELEAYRALDRAGGLGLQVRAALYVDPHPKPPRSIEEQVAELVALRDGESWGPHVVPGAAKLFADGVIESGTAALLAPYVGKTPASSGTLDWEPERLRQVTRALDAAGFQIHVHAIGDRAIRETLDAIEALPAGRDRRPVMAHIQLFDPRDLPRFRRLGVAASFQPLWAYADSYIRELTLPVLGPERSRWLYPIASMAKTGAVLAGGSDWSVSSMNPLDAIEVALTRRGPGEAAGEPWIGDERVDLSTMIAAYTIGSQWAMFGEHDAGSIEPGKYADLVVLEKNLFEIPVTEISDVAVAATYFGGVEVYRKP
jgi:predicted amidohydrolase YtcJ